MCCVVFVVAYGCCVWLCNFCFLVYGCCMRFCNFHLLFVAVAVYALVVIFIFVACRRCCCTWFCYFHLFILSLYLLFLAVDLIHLLLYRLLLFCQLVCLPFCTVVSVRPSFAFISDHSLKNFTK